MSAAYVSAACLRDVVAGARTSENQLHLTGFFADAIHTNWSFCGSGLHLAARRVELRAMPQTLNGAAYHHTARQRTTLVRAAVVERDVSVFGSCEDDAATANAQQFHLINLEFIALRNNKRLAWRGVERLVTPFPGGSVSVINAD